MQARLEASAVSRLRLTGLEHGVIIGLLVFLAGRALTWNWAGVASLIENGDHHIYMSAAARLLAGGPFYPDWQLAGPYTLERAPELYPPPTVALLIVSRSMLPSVLWWAIPLGILAALIVCWRPTAWAWVGILACFVPPWAWDGIAGGGLFMWVAAAVALGTRWPAMFVLALSKPSLLPFAFLGARSRWWWASLGAATLISAAFMPLWADFVRVLANLRGGTLLYSIHNIPLVVVPLVAYYGSSRRITEPVVRGPNRLR